MMLRPLLRWPPCLRSAAGCAPLYRCSAVLDLPDYSLKLCHSSTEHQLLSLGAWNIYFNIYGVPGCLVQTACMCEDNRSAYSQSTDCQWGAEGCGGRGLGGSWCASERAVCRYGHCRR